MYVVTKYSYFYTQNWALVYFDLNMFFSKPKLEFYGNQLFSLDATIQCTESQIYSSNVADRFTVSKTGIHYFVKLRYSLCTIGQSYLFA